MGGLNLNVVNFVFLIIGVLLHWTPASFLKAALEGGSFIWGVIVQFPFYAGIFGIIKFSGLSDVMGDWFTAIATKNTYPFIVVWYSGILNYIVPSGGAKWAIEAPYIMTAGKALGVSPQLTVIAYAWGDMVTDVIQPFWAIPLHGGGQARLPRHHGLLHGVLHDLHGGHIAWGSGSCRICIRISRRQAHFQPVRSAD